MSTCFKPTSGRHLDGALDVEAGGERDSHRRALDARHPKPIGGRGFFRVNFPHVPRFQDFLARSLRS